MSGVWVFVEHQAGAIKSVSKETLGAAQKVAQALGQPVVALVLGQDVAAIADEAIDHGAGQVIGCDDETMARFRVEAAGPLVAQLAREREPAAILAGSTTTGSELMAWVAAELDAGLVPDAVELVVEEGVLKATRPVYAGKLLSTVFVTGSPQLLTLRSRAFAAAEPMGQSGATEWVSAARAETDIPSKIINLEAKDGGVSLSDASIIVSGGRGVGGPEGYAPLRQLCDTLGAALGASRASVDAGWIPYEHQVGQTGKTVSPDLYIACGISGAIQHQAGMRTAKIIVAINKDAEAPIFKLASYGIVGDLFDVVPALTEEFRKRLG